MKRRPLGGSTVRRRRNLTAAAMVAVLGACGTPAPQTVSGGTAAPAAAAGPHEPGDSWAGREVTGLSAGYVSELAVNDAGEMVTVGTVSTDEPAVGIWRSEDGVTWDEVFRQAGDLSDDDAYLGMPGAAVAAGRGFVALTAACTDRCRPVALYSSDGVSWDEGEVEVRPAGEAAQPAGLAGGSGGGGVVGPKRLIRGSPDYTIHGAEILDVVAAGDRLVGVGWSEAPRYRTLLTVWHSDDDGRTWAQAPESTFPSSEGRDELNRVVRAGDRLVASGGNRCCHEQAVHEVWVSDVAGQRWRAVALPERTSIIDLVVVGDDVHVFGWPEPGDRPAHWRLSSDDGWERLPAPPGWGRLLAVDGSLVAAVLDPMQSDRPQRLALYRSVAGGAFELWKASAPLDSPALEPALVVDGRLRAYVATRSAGGDRRLVFEAGSGG